VQVHHQQVQAVAAVAVGTRHGVDAIRFDHVIFGDRGCREQRQAVAEATGFAAVGDRRQRCDHLAYRGQQLVNDLLRVGNQVGALRTAPRRGHHLVEFGPIDGRRDALVAQDGEGALEVVGAHARGLQQREVVLGTVVGGQRVVDQRRQQECVLAQRADDLELFCHVGSA
jgi:hypothetical protein